MMTAISKWPNSGSVWVGPDHGTSKWRYVHTGFDSVGGFDSADAAKAAAEAKFAIGSWATAPMVSMRGKFVAVPLGG